MTVGRRDGRPASPASPVSSWCAAVSHRKPGDSPRSEWEKALAAGRLRRRIEALEAERRLREELDWLD